MNLKNKGLLWLVCSLAVLSMVVYLLFPKEPFQEKPIGDGMEQLEKFCDQHFGKDEWGVDHIFHYNDKVLFVDVHTQGAVVGLSVHPENRAIIIENTRGPVLLKKRIYRF